MCKTQKRFDNIDVIIDQLILLAENMKRKTIIWPAICTLSLLCPDVLFSIGLTNASVKGSDSIRKFLDLLKKNLKGKSGDVSTFCYIDICRASTFVSKTDGVAVRMVVPNIESELKEKIFDSKNFEEFDVKLITDCLISLFKLNPWNTLRNLIPNLINTPFKIVLVKFCLGIVSEEFPLDWNPLMDASLAVPLRNLFLENIVRVSQVEKQSVKKIAFLSDKKIRKAQVEEAQVERTDIILNVLKAWCHCPLLAIAV